MKFFQAGFKIIIFRENLVHRPIFSLKINKKDKIMYQFIIYYLY